ncbi:hypothetical protein ARZXY2_4974 (plasmid) [Arthrobacter sp. ZXY-2]|nr:hypothetical protein ARZXY2_4974 [Arthrobacter sp. ZXY-2]
MGNLGLYQEITTLAKSLGGVDNLIKAIETGAVKKAAPALLAAGAVAGVGISKGATVLWAKYKESGVTAAEAKAKLKAIIEERMKSDDADAGPDGNPDTADS